MTPIAQDRQFWQMMWYLSILATILDFGLIITLFLSSALRLRWQIRAILAVILLALIIGSGLSASRLAAVDKLSFEARVFWPTTSLMAYLCLIGVIVSVIALLASFLTRALSGFRYGLFGVLILCVLIFICLPPQMGTRSPDMDIIDLYNDGIRAILMNDYTEGLQKLRGYSNHEWLLDVWRPRGWYKVDPDIGEAGEIIAGIDGGSLSQEDIRECVSQGSMPSIGYLIRPLGSYIIIINIMPDGRVYLLSRGGSSGSQLGISPPDIPVPDDVYRLLQEDLSQRTLEYQCPECYQTAIYAFIQDPIFTENASIREDMVGSLEYYNLCCNGRQVNGYWEPDGTRETPPWTTFRQAIINIIWETLERGNTISVGTYLGGIQGAEAQYGFQSLTGYEWSKFYIETTSEL